MCTVSVKRQKNRYVQPSFLWIYWTSSYLNLVVAFKKSLIFKALFTLYEISTFVELLNENSPHKGGQRK